MTKIDPLFIDCYEGDGRKDWFAFVTAGPPWHGVILKATQGLYCSPPWYALQRKKIVDTARGVGRYGVDFFDGAYHYLDLAQDGVAQCDFALKAIIAAGGEMEGTIPLMVDVERGGQKDSRNISRQQVEDCTEAFADRYRARTGRGATLYGGELLRAVAVRGRMGCDRSVVALYGAELHGKGESTASFLRRTGTDLGHLMMWQYCGDGTAELAGYPSFAPGCGKIDISVLTLPGGLPAIRALMQRA